MELTTNSLRGTVRYTNQNPEILALFETDPWRSAFVQADSSAPRGYQAATSSVTFASGREYTFEMLVEAGAGGEAGVKYSVSAYRGPRYSSTNLTVANVIVRSRSLQPEPTQVTIERCMGVLRFVGGTDTTCQQRVPLSGLDSPGTLATYPREGTYLGYFPGGTTWSGTLTYAMSTASGWLTATRDFNVPVTCDEIVTICLPQPPPPAPPPPLVQGTLTGPWQVQGETAVGQQLTLSGGPQSVTLSLYDSTPSAPVSDPSSWWMTPSAPEGTGYRLWTTAFLRSGRDSMVAWTPYLKDLSVVGNQATPVTRVVDGETRHAFVMQPSYFHGSIRLVDPYVTQHPGARSSLASLLFSDRDSNGDGHPDCLSCATSLQAVSDANTLGGAASLFRGSFNASTGQLSSAYEQALLSPYNLPTRWLQNNLRLSFFSITGDAEPSHHRSGSLYLQQRLNAATLGPGERFRVDHEYCFNEVLLEYWTSQGRLFNPHVQVSGDFQGPDWRGTVQSYVGSGGFQGTPTQLATAQPRGSVYLALPQGLFSLQPLAFMVNAAGQVNTANFAPISLQLGCGQRLKIVPPLTVSVDPVPGCAQSSTVPVSGTVRSAPSTVDRVWYRLNGGPEVTLCTNCGVNPAFSFTVPLQSCGNSVEVFAFTEGMPEPSTGFQQLVWDDPADGPSCAGGCVTSPPPPPPPPPPPQGEGCSEDEAQAPLSLRLLGEQHLTLECGVDTWHDPGAVASEGCSPVAVHKYNSGDDDGDGVPGSQDPDDYGPGPAPNAEGTYSVQYIAWNAAGTTVSAIRTVTVNDSTPPTLRLRGAAQMTHTCGSPWVDPGVEAQDACYGDVSPTVVKSGYVNGWVPGTYTVTYSLTDSGGNSAPPLTRTVQVANCPW